METPDTSPRAWRGDRLPSTLAELLAWVQHNEDVVRTRLAPLDEAHLNWKPAPDRWSVGQCLEHLTRSDAPYLDRLEALFGVGASDSPDPRSVPLDGSWFGRWFVKSLLPTSARRFKAPRDFQPSASHVPRSVVPDYLELTRRCRAVAIRGAVAGLERGRIVSPVSALMRFRPSDALRLLAVHGARHVQQAVRVLETPGFGS